MYINPNTLSNQSDYAPGLVQLKPEQESLYFKYKGFVRIVSVEPVKLEPDIESYQKWCAEHPEPKPVPEPEPTQLDIIEAQVTYTAMMTDTLLEV